MNPLPFLVHYFGLAYAAIKSSASTLSSWAIPATILSVKLNPNSFYQFNGFTSVCVLSIIGVVIMGVALAWTYKQFMKALVNYGTQRVQFMASISFVLVAWIIYSIVSSLQNLAQYSQEGMFYSSDNTRPAIENQNGALRRIQ